MTSRIAMSIRIPDTATLLSAYMPFLERGGLFVPTRTPYSLGDPVVLLMALPDEDERQTVHGQVVWLSPEGISGRRMPGIGVHFNQSCYAMRDRIETLLAGQLDQAAPSYTL